MQPLRHNHQVGKTHVIREAGLGIRQQGIVSRRYLLAIRLCRCLSFRAKAMLLQVASGKARKRDCASPVSGALA